MKASSKNLGGKCARCGREGSLTLSHTPARSVWRLCGNAAGKCQIDMLCVRCHELWQQQEQAIMRQHFLPLCTALREAYLEFQRSHVPA